MYSQKRCSAEKKKKKKKRVIRGESASDKENVERFHVEKDVSDANNASCRRLPPVLLYKFLKMDLVYQGSLYPRVLHDLKLQRLSEDHLV
ncbi:0ea7a79b-7c14-4c56-9ea8-393f827f72e2 [Sclerotinia trifoliorum]|uniref:0ea7a79b-7c14-4c56-9ea8-393f827f72e2 n=1 Tax=Sclerotinia trifoliorum TaxID=28548 RepID=A0A8H2ZR53_9HELO|nr:0ea7a79b-7c14-4c56-9ea8-393f827f72e2 [Sclerotinia trifoliorum]